MAQLLSIITYPNKTLRVRCDEVKKVDDKIRRLILNMEKTMQAKEGIGLAAPQVGKTIRLLIVSTKDGAVAMVNPKITKKSWSKEPGEEGCLSIPGFYGTVKRHKKINVIYTDKRGQRVRLAAEGLLARVIQHEIDHINGVLFIDYLSKKYLKDLPKES